MVHANSARENSSSCQIFPRHVVLHARINKIKRRFVDKTNDRKHGYLQQNDQQSTQDLSLQWTRVYGLRFIEGTQYYRENITDLRFGFHP